MTAGDNICSLTAMSFLAAPPKPQYAQLFERGCISLYLIEVVNRVTSKGKRLERVIALSRDRLYVLEVTANGKHIVTKRNPPTLEITKVSYCRPIVKGSKVDQLLITIPTQVDILLEFREESSGGAYGNATTFLEMLKKLRLAQQATNSKSRPFEVVKETQSEDMFKKGNLDVSKSAHFRKPADEIKERLKASSATTGSPPTSPTASPARTTPSTSPARTQPSIRQQSPLGSPYTATAASPTRQKEQIHEIAHMFGLEAQVPPANMVCVGRGCGKQELHQDREGYYMCRTCPEAILCVPCYKKTRSKLAPESPLGRALPPHEDSIFSAPSELPPALPAHDMPQDAPKKYPAAAVSAQRAPSTSSSEEEVQEYPPSVTSYVPGPGGRVSPQYSPSPAPYPHDSGDLPVGGSPILEPVIFGSPERSPSKGTVRRVPPCVSEDKRMSVSPRASPEFIDPSQLPSPQGHGPGQNGNHPSLFPSWEGGSAVASPPPTWCYYEMVNPDPVARQTTYYVYKKRCLQLEDVDGSRGSGWLTISSRRQVTDRIYIGHITKIGENTPQSASLVPLRIAFFVESAGERHVFLTPTAIEKDAWISWFHHNHPKTK